MRQYKQQSGFTIIEVMLFLAITGLMLAGVMVAINGTINRQRYTEAVDSFHDYLQSQYALVSSVRNNRPGTVECNTGASGGIVDGGSSPRGTSDCTIIGRYVHTTGSGGKNIVSAPVYARTDVNSRAIQSPEPSDKSIVDRVADLNLLVTPSDDTLNQDDDDYTLAWQTNIYTSDANRNDGAEFAMLIIRMPTDSLTRTFVRLGPAPESDLTVVFRNAVTDSTVVCVNPAGLTSSPANGVIIQPNAINTNSIQYATAGSCP